jgi:RNase P subunit RPR2|uniref:C4-type zinc ribbon domain-containing protein n=1 Tax=candidate division WOR-3 bacterium TaxID=2052148 RepID=A0A7C3YSB8_UNCW3
MNPTLELLRALEEFDMIIRDLQRPDYKKLGFAMGKNVVLFLKSVEEEREKIRKKIDKNLLAEYDRIKKRYGERVVVQVVKDFCGGCYVKLPSGIAARCQNEILTCPHCGRFLYRIK